MTSYYPGCLVVCVASCVALRALLLLLLLQFSASAFAAALPVLYLVPDARALLHEVLQWLLLRGEQQGDMHLLLISILCVSYWHICAACQAEAHHDQSQKEH